MSSATANDLKITVSILMRRYNLDKIEITRDEYTALQKYYRDSNKVIAFEYIDDDTLVVEVIEKP